MYISFFFHFLTLTEIFKTNKNNFLHNDSSFWKTNEWDGIRCLGSEAPLFCLPPAPTHVSFTGISVNLWFAGGNVPLGSNKIWLLHTCIGRQVKHMHNTGVFKKERKKDFITEASAKRLDWTSWAFKYYIIITNLKNILSFFLDFIFSGIQVQEFKFTY